MAPAFTWSRRGQGWLLAPADGTAASTGNDRLSRIGAACCAIKSSLTSRRIVGLSVLLLVLFAFQSIFVAIRTDYSAIAALHPLNGFAVLAVSIVITLEAWTMRRAPTRKAAARDEPTSATVDAV